MRELQLGIMFSIANAGKGRMSLASSDVTQEAFGLEVYIYTHMFTYYPYMDKVSHSSLCCSIALAAWHEVIGGISSGQQKRECAACHWRRRFLSQQFCVAQQCAVVSCCLDCVNRSAVCHTRVAAVAAARKVCNAATVISVDAPAISTQRGAPSKRTCTYTIYIHKVICILFFVNIYVYICV